MFYVVPEIEWMVCVIFVLLLLGVLVEIVFWIVGFFCGMYVIVQKNLLLVVFVKMNKNGVLVMLVILQLVIMFIVLIIFINIGGGNNMFFLIVLVLMVVIYLCVYFMLFIGYIVLVFKYFDLKCIFNIFGGKGVKLVVVIVGLLTLIMVFIVFFLLLDNIQGDFIDMYVELLVVSFLVVFVLFFIFYVVYDCKGKVNIGVILELINSQNVLKGYFFLYLCVCLLYYIVMNDKKY